MRNKYRLYYYLILLLTSTDVLAKDLGKMGHVFEIKEESFIAMMKRKLTSIDIEEHKQKMQDIAKDRVNNPVPVEGIEVTTKDRVFYHDPTYELKEDAVLPCGKILHKAGTKVNPLEYMSLDRRLFFIDSRDELQVEWLVEQLEQPLVSEPGSSVSINNSVIEDRVVLVGGSVLKLQEEIATPHKDKIYFDQSGEIVGRVGIQHVPAIAVQEGLKIRVEEIVIDIK